MIQDTLMMEDDVCALVIDDDDVDRERLIRLLKLYNKNFNVTEASSKTNAIKELHELRSRLSFIFLDFKLEDGDGRELLPEIWESVSADCVLIAVTGNGSENDAAHAIKLGIHEYLSKHELTSWSVAAAIEDGLRHIDLLRSIRAAEDELRHKSLHDPLTDLPNRHVLFDRLEQRCVAYRRDNAPFAVLMIDLDKFKQINDDFGHKVGDEVLIQTASRLLKTVREIDTIARLGGDEFAIILPGMHSLDVAHAMASKLAMNLRQPMVIGELMIIVGASIGISVCPQHGSDVMTLLRRADNAMYRGKKGLEKVVIYDEREPQSSNFLDRMVLLGEVELAISRGEIDWYWQPKINLETRKVEGFETLARWTHCTHGPIATNIFIAAIESSTVILIFALATIDRVIEQMLELNHLIDSAHISINISARVLEHSTFVDELIKRIDHSKLDPGRFVLELTETALIGNPAEAKKIIDRLSRYGVTLSIDDFGAGFTSFGYLRDFKVQEIKIDQSYILNLTENQFNQSLVRCLSVFCDTQGINLIAEGVETKECWDELLRLGCKHGQGYFIARPMPFDEVIEWLEAWSRGDNV